MAKVIDLVPARMRVPKRKLNDRFMKQQKLTKKQFKEMLNKKYSGQKWKNFAYGQRKREYGDYLYSQDKVMFEMILSEYLATGKY